jgi:hypothetical protein
MEPDFLSDFDPQAVRTGAFGAAAGWPCLDRLDPHRSLAWQDGMHRDLEASPLVQRGLLDLGGGGPVSRHSMRRENLWRASRTGWTVARRLRRKTVSETTDAKLPPSDSRTLQIAR